MVALEGGPAGSLPLIIGDSSFDLNFPRDRQEKILSAPMRKQGMRCASRFPRRTRRTRGQWAWRQRRDIPGTGQTQWLKSKLDYFLFREKDRRRIKCCRWSWPWHHDSDHRALIVDIRARPGEIPCYVEGRVKLPVQPPPPKGINVLQNCPPPWRRCRDGNERAMSGSTMAHGGSSTNAAIPAQVGQAVDYLEAVRRMEGNRLGKGGRARARTPRTTRLRTPCRWQSSTLQDSRTGAARGRQKVLK